MSLQLLMIQSCMLEIFIQEWHTSIIGERQCREGTLDQYFGEFYNACFGFAKQIEQNSCILFVVWETM